MRFCGGRVGAVLGAAVFAACGPPAEGGDAAGAGGPADGVHQDAGPDGGVPDAGSDAGGADAAPDAGPGVDAAADAGPGVDAGPDGGPDTTAPCDGNEGLERTLWVTGLPEVQVVDMSFDGAGRALVALKDGTIRVVRDGTLLPDPFVVVPDTSDAWIENGVLGIAFDPDFPANPWVYVFQSYVTTPGAPGVPGECDKLDCPFALEPQPDGTTRVVNAPAELAVFGNTRQRVVRFDASADVVAPGDMEVLLDDLPGGTQTHNGGGLAFAKDGTLFVGLGDSTTPPNAQDFSNVAGCILRITTDGEAPPDNPFVAADDGIPDVIWACGVRQGFGLAVHPDTGELYQAENGPSFGDELNWIPKGGNLGWPLGAGPQGVDGLTDPVQAWTPTVSPTKVVVYAGERLAGLRGDILVGAWNEGDVKRLHLADPAGSPGALAWEGDLIPYVGKPVLVAQDRDGGLYVGEHLSGEIWRVDPVSACDAPQAVVAVTPEAGTAPLKVELDGSASTVRPPATKVVKHHWELGPIAGHPEGDLVSQELTHPGVLTGMLTVVDDLGRHGQTLFTVAVEAPAGDAPPIAHLASAKPQSGEAPLEVALVGGALDPEGALAELRWSFGDGTDDAVTADAKSGAYEERIHLFTAPGTYEVTLTAKDAAGQSGAATVTIEVE